MDWSSESAPERTSEPYASLQCPNERKPIFFSISAYSGRRPDEDLVRPEVLAHEQVSAIAGMVVDPRVHQSAFDHVCRTRAARARASIAEAKHADSCASQRLPSASRADAASGIVTEASSITRPDIVTSVSQRAAWA